jgi:hypothetical protein
MVNLFLKAVGTKNKLKKKLCQSRPGGGGSAVVKHSPHHHKAEGLSPPAVGGTGSGREEMTTSLII